jgi:hypothetical protein
VLLFGGAAGQAQAQTKAFVPYVQGGRWLPFVDLNSENGDRFTAEWTWGAGIAWQLSEKFAVRGSFTNVNTQIIGNTLTLDDPNVTRWYYVGDLLFGWPTASGWVPYGYVGAGVVTTTPKDSTLAAEDGKSTAFTGRGGLGINRITSFGVMFLESDLWLWRLNSLDVEFYGLKAEWGFRLGLGLVIPY